MLADCCHLLARPYPRTCGGCGIEIVDAAVGWVPAVERVLCGAKRGVVWREIDLSVINCCERATLVDDARDCVREVGVLHAVENDGADCDLPSVGFAARFGVDGLGKQILVAARLRRRACEAYAHCAGGLFADYAVGGQAIFLLERLYCGFRFRAVYAINRATVVAPVL